LGEAKERIMGISRDAVEKYATEHWFTPCHDNHLYSYVKGTVNVDNERARLKTQGKLSGDGWKAVILPAVEGGKLVEGKERGCFIRPNPTGGQEILANVKPPQLAGKFDIVPFYEVAGKHDGLVDCAHYVSCCYTAGGVKINHPGVPELVHDLRARADTRTLGLEVPLVSGQRIMDSGVMKVGDLIAYVHEDPKTKQRGYSHSAIYVGLGSGRTHRITCHTTARFKESFFDDTWNITTDKDWRFTLIHFADDSYPPIIKPLRFRVLMGATPELWEFRANGKIVRARAGRGFGATAGDNGYWFLRGFTIFVFWPRTGQVGKVGFTSFDDLGTFPIVVDGMPAVMEPVMTF
jgi:hypothetical protein